MKYVRVRQKVNSNVIGTAKLPASEFPDVISAAEFAVKQSYGETWHKRCLPPISRGDMLLFGEQHYEFTDDGDITIPDCRLKLKRRTYDIHSSLDRNGTTTD